MKWQRRATPRVPSPIFLSLRLFSALLRRCESYSQPMQREFVIERSKAHTKKNVQFAACRRENLPLVSITPGRKFGLVEVDMITTNRNLDDAAIRDIFTIFAEHTDAKYIKVSAVLCRAERVPRSSAEAAASRAFEVAVAAMPRLRPIGVRP